MGDVLWIIITGPHGDQKVGSGRIGPEEATRQLAVVLSAMSDGGMVELPWFVTRSTSVVAAYTAGIRG